tara:strand:- start:87 stop:377 length:291 start_codon:yes stop_codon:yes gene_type:complete
MKRTAFINDFYKVEIDESNHTLLEFRAESQKPDGKAVKSGWKVIGYYSNMANVLSAVKNILLLDGQSVSIIDQCMDLVSSAEKVCSDFIKNIKRGE